MDTFIAPAPGETGKFRGVIQAFPAIWEGHILDVGCRSGNLRRMLASKQITYLGVDLFPPADVVANLEQDLPFGNESFDVVVALDVLEHTDNMHQAFAELCRVSRRYVVLSLPNAYEIAARWKFLTGRPLSGKYTLTAEPPLDRHKWLFSLREAQHFVATLGPQHGFQVLTEGALVGPRRALIKRVVSAFPNLLVPWYIALLGKKEMA